MKKTIIIEILGLLVACTLFGCTDNNAKKQNDVYLARAIIHHSMPNVTEHYFDFNYIYDGSDIFEKDYLIVTANYIDVNGDEHPRTCAKKINGISYDFSDYVFITPNASITVGIGFGNSYGVDISQYKSVTITYDRMSEVDKSQIYKTLTSKTFLIDDLISQATDIPYRR